MQKFIFWQEGSIATGILLTPNTPLPSLPVGSNTVKSFTDNNIITSIFGSGNPGLFDRDGAVVAAK